MILWFMVRIPVGPPSSTMGKRPKRTSMPPVYWRHWVDGGAFKMRPKPSGRFTPSGMSVKKRIDGQPPEYSTVLLSDWARGNLRHRK